MKITGLLKCLASCLGTFVLVPVLALILVNVMFVSVLQAQQDVAFSGGVPVAPTGIENPTLADGPFRYATAEGMDINVVVVARGIEYPTSMVFIGDDKMLVSTRTGLIHLIENDTLQEQTIGGGPASVFRGGSGLPGSVHGYMDLALHPDFEENGLIYLSYTQAYGDEVGLSVGRGRWDGSAIQGFNNIWVGGVGTGGPGRLIFGQEGKLYISVSGGNPQDLTNLGGSILRLNDDGSTPDDNPFVGQANARGEIYTYGHRNSLGLAVHPGTGDIWQNENGPNGGDEVNVLVPGLNYGWPIVSLGRTYQGPWQSERPGHENFEPPVAYWMPAIAVSGMTFYTGDALPKWKGDVLVGALRTGEIPGTGHLERILFNQNMEELRRETLLVDLHQRIRDVRQGPDELIYIATDEVDGAILRIEPAN